MHGLHLGRAEFIVSRNYRMPIYWDFQNIEEYILSNLQYWVSGYSQNQWFILSFFAENSPNVPKILRKFRKFPENSENAPKIRWKFAENSLKRRSLEAEISYREIKPNIVPISYQIEKKRIAQGCPWALIGKYFNNTGTVHYTPQCTMHCTLHYIMHCILYCSIKV